MLYFFYIGLIFSTIQVDSLENNTAQPITNEYILIFEDVDQILSEYDFSSELMSAADFSFKVRGDAVQFDRNRIIKRYQLISADGSTPDIEQIRSKTGASHVERNYYYELDLEIWNDTYVDSQWYLPIIELDKAHQITKGNPDVVIALIDTGIDRLHEDLQDKLYINTNEAPDGRDTDGNGFIDDDHGWNFVHDNPDIRDDQGHGTAMAGIIAAEANNNKGIVGIAPGARIMPLKAFDERGQGSLFNVIRAILYAVDNGAQIINMSFGFSDESVIERMTIEHAASRGVTLITSAGNVGGPNRRFPAAYDDVIAVSWTNQNDRISSLASYGPHISVAAPGSQIYTTNFVPGQTNAGYRFVTGSSASSAVVSGIAALMLSNKSHLTPDQIRAQLQLSAKDIMNEGWDNFTGAGRINAHRALITEKFTKARIDSILIEDDEFIFRGSAYHPSMQHYKIKLAAGLREPLTFTTLFESSGNILDGELGRIPLETFSESPTGYQTLSLVITGKNGETDQHRKHFFPTESPPDIHHNFTLPGLQGDRQVIASNWQSNYPVELFGSINGFETSSVKSATQHLLWYPASEIDSSKEVVRGRHPLISLETSEVQTSDIGKINTRLSIQNQQNLSLSTNRIFAFSDGRWPELDEYFISSTLSQSNPRLIIHHYDDGQIQEIEILREFGIPRAIDDFTGDGKPEMMIQFGSQFIVLQQEDDRVVPSKFLPGAAPLDGWGITMADLSGSGETQAWAYSGDQIIYYTWEGSLSQRHDTNIQISNLTTPVAVVHDITQNGINELLIGNEDELFIIGLDNDEYVILETIITRGKGSNTGFQVIESNGEVYIVASSVGEQQSDNFGITHPDYQLISLFKAESEAISLKDEIIIRGASVSQRDMQKVTWEDEELAVYTNLNQMYVFGITDDEKISFRYYQEGFQTINTAVLANSAILAGTSDRETKIIGDVGKDSAIVWMRAPIKSDSITVFAQFRGDAESIRTSYLNTGDDFRLSLNPSPGKIYEVGRFAVDTTQDLHNVEIQLVRDGAVLSERREEFSLSNTFEISEVLLTEYEISVFTSGPVSFQLSSFSEIYAHSNIESGLREVLPNSPRNFTFVFDQALPRNVDISFPFIRNSDYADAENANEVFSVSRQSESLENFYITNHEILSDQKILLKLNKPIDETSISVADYFMSPRGSVSDVTLRGNNELELSISGTVLRGSGISQTLEVRDLRSTDASSINTEIGNQIEIVDQPSDLANIRVYPNPWNRNEVDQVTFAGVPMDTRIQIYSIDGRFVNELIVENPNGGMMWNGQSRNGGTLGSGVYLFRATLGDDTTELKKIVIVR